MFTAKKKSLGKEKHIFIQILKKKIEFFNLKKLHSAFNLFFLKVPQVGGGGANNNSPAQQPAPIVVVPHNVHQAPENVGN